MLWDEERELHRIADVLAAAVVPVPSGWRLQTASDIVETDAGITICGTGTNPAGHTEAWIARY
ncbi:MAG: hypothetical protein IPK72_22045 [Candidatus Eisenbacteria bacterium]|nr:hypothetical protein [Candidatus Eisenbacteria bacterium]